MYSKKAIPQLIKIIEKRPRPCDQLISLNLRWPYQARVMKVFDRTNRIIV
jgi:hypothetical protein